LTLHCQAILLTARVKLRSRGKAVAIDFANGRHGELPRIDDTVGIIAELA
jgi:hypothetical protein